MQARAVVTLAERRDLIPFVTTCLWEAFWHRRGHSIEDLHDLVAASVAPVGPPQGFVLLVDGEPVGTASLVEHDLEERPDLTPWLAGVVVLPAARGNGYVHDLLRAVEAACAAAAIPTLWLYTSTAEPIYRRAGWRSVETFDRAGTPTALMRRDLAGPRPPPGGSAEG